MQNENNLINYLKNPQTSKIPQSKFFFHENYKKQEIEFTIEEEIISYQFNNSEMKDFHEIFGLIGGKVNMSDNPEISLGCKINNKQ